MSDGTLSYILRHMSATVLRIGDWLLDPSNAQISRSEQTVQVEARSLRLLLCLAENPGDVVSVDTLLNQGSGGVMVTPDSVYQTVTSLRRLLGDDARKPTYIATVPRLGYRLIAPVVPMVPVAPEGPATPAADPVDAASDKAPPPVVAPDRAATGSRGQIGLAAGLIPIWCGGGLPPDQPASSACGGIANAQIGCRAAVSGSDGRDE